MREIEVIRETRAALQRHGIGGRRVIDLYTDVHSTLLADTSLRPFQRFTLALDGLVVQPDLVGRLDDGETTFAIEAKGTDDHLTGLAQAASYRLGFHLVFLAAAAFVVPDVVTLARQLHVGVLVVAPDAVTVLALAPPYLPRLVSGAQNLEIVRVRGDTVELTIQGLAASRLLPYLAAMLNTVANIANETVCDHIERCAGSPLPLNALFSTKYAQAYRADRWSFLELLARRISGNCGSHDNFSYATID